MNRASLRRFAFTAGAFAGFAALASAFVLLSPPRKWHASQLPRNFKIGMAKGENSLAATFTSTAAQGSVDVWNAAVTGDTAWTGGAAFTKTVDNALGNIGFVNDGVSTITFEDPQNLLSGATLGASYIGWYTTSATEVVNGTTFYKYTDSDVVMNNNVEFTSYLEADAIGANGNAYDIEGILVQEVGHSLGLDHPSIEQASMYGSLSTNDWRKRDLDDDDVNGIRFTYVNGYHAVNFAAGTQLVADPTFLGLSTATFKPNSKVYLRITVVDENKNTVSGASVTVTVTRPDGSTGTGTASTSSTGRVTFDSGGAQHGTYTTSVTNITKAGMTFNAALGKSSDSVVF